MDAADAASEHESVELVVGALECIRERLGRPGVDWRCVLWEIVENAEPWSRRAPRRSPLRRATELVVTPRPELEADGARPKSRCSATHTRLPTADALSLVRRVRPDPEPRRAAQHHDSFGQHREPRGRQDLRQRAKVLTSSVPRRSVQ